MDTVISVNVTVIFRLRDRVGVSIFRVKFSVRFRVSGH